MCGVERFVCGFLVFFKGSFTFNSLEAPIINFEGIIVMLRQFAWRQASGVYKFVCYDS